MSASPKTRCSSSSSTNTRASTSRTSPATSSNITYEPEPSAIERIPDTGQWNGFVELMPLWLAPNMITLLGFFFILGNVALLEVYIPDLVGPVSPAAHSRPRIARTDWNVSHRPHHGYTTASLSACGCKPCPLSRVCVMALTDASHRYSTMDNIDGKQARRTGTSSPLGELFEYVQGLPNAPKPVR